VGREIGFSSARAWREETEGDAFSQIRRPEAWGFRLWVKREDQRRGRLATRLFRQIHRRSECDLHRNTRSRNDRSDHQTSLKLSLTGSSSAAIPPMKSGTPWTVADRGFPGKPQGLIGRENKAINCAVGVVADSEFELLVLVSSFTVGHVEAVGMLGADVDATVADDGAAGAAAGETLSLTRI
jgi:hypothetical protein